MSLAEMPPKAGREIRAQTENPRTAAAQEGAQRRKHLYVMQNAWGLIKVGRSDDPEKRRRDLENASGCRIELVAVLEECGHFEASLFADMRGHRLIGEWFAPTVMVKAAIRETFGGRNWKWPFVDATDGEAVRQAQLSGRWKLSRAKPNRELPKPHWRRKRVPKY